MIIKEQSGWRKGKSVQNFSWVFNIEIILKETISKLILNNGEWLCTPTDISHEIENYFAKIFSFQSSPPLSSQNFIQQTYEKKLSIMQKQSCEGLITERVYGPCES